MIDLPAYALPLTIAGLTAAAGAGLLVLLVRRTRPDPAPTPAAPVDPAERAKRRAGLLLTAALTMVVLALLCAAYFSGWAMWHTVDHKFGLGGQVHLILPIFGLFDLLAVAFALLAAYNMIVRGERGVPYLLLWVFVVLSGLMSASDGTNPTERFMRFMAPIAAAVAFEVLLAAKAHSLRGTRSALARAWMWFKARRGWVGAMDVGQATAARRVAAGKLANLRYTITQRKPDSKGRARAVRRYLAELRRANERIGFANDPAAIDMFRVALASLYGALADTGPDAVADASPWSPLPAEPAPAEPTPAAVPPVNGHKPGLPLITVDPLRPTNGHRPTPSPTPPPPAFTPDAGTGGRPKRSAAETRAAYERLVRERPGLKQAEYADLLEIAPKTLRTALANTATRR